MENQNNPTISFFQFTEEHYADLRYLMRIVFKKRVGINYLKNKYADYLNIGFISTIAYDGKQPVGFYGAIPQEFQHNGRLIRVAHACDAYTIPEYQGKGIHFQLARLSYALMKVRDIEFVYAFHSENTYQSTKKLDWKVRGQMFRFHMYAGVFPRGKVYKKLNLQKYYQRKVKVELQPYMKEKFNYFSSHDHQIINAVFFDYKNGFYSHYLIELENCFFYLKVDAIAHIGFFSFPNLENLGRALKKLKQIMGGLGVSEILFQCSENSKMYAGLSAFLQPYPSWKIGYLTFEQIDVSTFEFTYANLDTF